MLVAAEIKHFQDTATQLLKYHTYAISKDPGVGGLRRRLELYTINLIGRLDGLSLKIISTDGFACRL